MFLVLQCLGLPLAFLISNPEEVQREDGTKVRVEEKTSTREQLRILGRTMVSRKVGVLLPIFFCESSVTSLRRGGQVRN